MRQSALLLVLAAFAGCEDDRPLVAADCRDGSHITGTRDVVESRCARRGGVLALTPLGENPPPAGNGTDP